MVPVLAIILHDMPQDRMIADGNHWFWNIFRVITDSSCLNRRKIGQPS